MLDYVFFDPRPCRRFVQFLEQRGVVHELDDVDDAFDLDTLEVRVPEDLDEALEQAIEDEYERLMAWSQELAEQAGGEAGGDYQAAGVVVNLKDGRTVYAHIDSGLLSRIMAAVTPREFGLVVDAIVDAVENPDERSLCGRMRDEE
jgi:hypothetical protein